MANLTPAVDNIDVTMTTNPVAIDTVTLSDAKLMTHSMPVTHIKSTLDPSLEMDSKGGVSMVTDLPNSAIEILPTPTLSQLSLTKTLNPEPAEQYHSIITDNAQLKSTQTSTPYLDVSKTVTIGTQVVTPGTAPVSSTSTIQQQFDVLKSDNSALNSTETELLSGTLHSLTPNAGMLLTSSVLPTTSTSINSPSKTEPLTLNSEATSSVRMNTQSASLHIDTGVTLSGSTLETFSGSTLETLPISTLETLSGSTLETESPKLGSTLNTHMKSSETLEPSGTGIDLEKTVSATVPYASASKFNSVLNMYTDLPNLNPEQTKSTRDFFSTQTLPRESHSVVPTSPLSAFQSSTLPVESAIPIPPVDIVPSSKIPTPVLPSILDSSKGTNEIAGIPPMIPSFTRRVTSTSTPPSEVAIASSPEPVPTIGGVSLLTIILPIVGIVILVAIVMTAVCLWRRKKGHGPSNRRKAVNHSKDNRDITIDDILPVLPPDSPSTAESTPRKRLYRVKHDYVALSDDQLSIEAGELIEVMQEQGQGHQWVKGKQGNREGIIPANYIEPTDDPPMAVTHFVNELSPYAESHVQTKLTHTAIYPYTAKHPEELSLKPGDLLISIDLDDLGWMKGQLRSGSTGWFPASYVEEIGQNASQSENIDLYGTLKRNKLSSSSDDVLSVTSSNSSGDYIAIEHVALYPYTAQQEGDLSFCAGDTITVLQVLDNGWWRGCLNGDEGWFPGSYCQLVEDYTFPCSSPEQDSDYMPLVDFKPAPATTSPYAALDTPNMGVSNNGFDENAPQGKKMTPTRKAPVPPKAAKKLSPTRKAPVPPNDIKKLRPTRKAPSPPKGQPTRVKSRYMVTDNDTNVTNSPSEEDTPMKNTESESECSPVKRKLEISTPQLVSSTVRESKLGEDIIQPVSEPQLQSTTMRASKMGGDIKKEEKPQRPDKPPLPIRFVEPKFVKIPKNSLKLNTAQTPRNRAVPKPPPRPPPPKLAKKAVTPTRPPPPQSPLRKESENVFLKRPGGAKTERPTEPIKKRSKKGPKESNVPVIIEEKPSRPSSLDLNNMDVNIKQPKKPPNRPPPLNIPSPGREQDVDSLNVERREDNITPLIDPEFLPFSEKSLPPIPPPPNVAQSKPKPAPRTTVFDDLKSNLKVMAKERSKLTPLRMSRSLSDETINQPIRPPLPKVMSPRSQVPPGDWTKQLDHEGLQDTKTEQLGVDHIEMTELGKNSSKSPLTKSISDQGPQNRNSQLNSPINSWNRKYASSAKAPTPQPRTSLMRLNSNGSEISESPSLGNTPISASNSESSLASQPIGGYNSNTPPRSLGRSRPRLGISSLKSPKGKKPGDPFLCHIDDEGGHVKQNSISGLSSDGSILEEPIRVEGSNGIQNGAKSENKNTTGDNFHENRSSVNNNEAIWTNLKEIMIFDGAICHNQDNGKDIKI
ncbi:unnamed protein product [Owenia fusiformis]|uniref:Uncharacterized protein n=1 Tax=Owenia fusiformis TaxID=6347 RepID=A0A8J1TFU8_OWEFU|nr:unnamed protein product [Owenia fusiformis]